MKDQIQQEHLIYWEHNYKYEREISRVLEDEKESDNDDT
jgi:hypothetical protein